MGANIWTYVHLETASIGLVQLSSSHWQEVLGKEEKDVWISDIESGLRLRRTRNRYVKKNQ
jgi:hypothetical protein